MLPFATKLIPVGFPTLGSLYSSQMVSHFFIKRQMSINQSQIIFFTGQMFYFSPNWEQICGLVVYSKHDAYQRQGHITNTLIVILEKRISDLVET